MIDEARRERTRRRRLLPVIGLIAVVLVAAVWLLQRDDRSAGDIGTGEAGEVLVEREALALTGVQLTSVDDGIDPATGLPTEERERYEAGEGARLWVQFTYTGDAPGRDSLFVRWFRDGQEIFQSSWRLPQPVENHNVALGASYTEDPGSYRVEVLLNDEVLHTSNFVVD